VYVADGILDVVPVVQILTKRCKLLTKARFYFSPLGETHPWSSRAQFLVVDLSKRLPRGWLNSIAVLRLISWNFIGCSIGKSAGLAPFNILLTDSRK
jgi:hypothetical protein